MPRPVSGTWLQTACLLVVVAVVAAAAAAVERVGRGERFSRYFDRVCLGLEEWQHIILEWRSHYHDAAYDSDSRYRLKYAFAISYDVLVYVSVPVEPACG